MRAAGITEHGAALGKLRSAEAWHDVRAQQHGAVGAVHRHGHLKVRGQVALPAEAGEVVRHAADGVGSVALQVDVAVAVHVHGKAVDAAGQELRQAHGTGIAALHRQRVAALPGAEDEELFEFTAEESAAVLAAGWEVKGQRGQRVDDAEVAGDAPVEGFDADDGHHDVGGHAPAVLRFLQPGFVVAPEGHARSDALRVDETCAVGGPVLGRAGGRRHDELAHRVQALRLGKLCVDPGQRQAVAFRHFGGKGLGGRVAGIGGCGGAGGLQAGGLCPQGH